MSYADDSYGNLVPVKNPFGLTTNVYTRVAGKFASFQIGTGDHEQAITEVRRELRIWGRAPVLAVIDGGAP